MLVYQGAASFELWLERPAPVSVMMDAAMAAMREREASGANVAVIPAKERHPVLDTGRNPVASTNRRAHSFWIPAFAGMTGQDRE